MLCGIVLTILQAMLYVQCFPSSLAHQIIGACHPCTGSCENKCTFTGRIFPKEVLSSSIFPCVSDTQILDDSQTLTIHNVYMNNVTLYIIIPTVFTFTRVNIIVEIFFLHIFYYLTFTHIIKLSIS